MDDINGKTLIDWGFKPGPWFGSALDAAKTASENGYSEDEIRDIVSSLEPAPVEEVSLRTNYIPFGQFVAPETEDEKANINAVIQHMDALMRVPTIKQGAIMPDACPSGSAPGTIPVGGVVACENAIHPDFHSADVCCSMAISVFKRRDDARKVLDIAMKATHFGPGERKRSDIFSRATGPLLKLIDTFESNHFLKGLEQFATRQFMTQGDGNHFLFVGELESTGQLAIVTHHGSRGLGAQIFKKGRGVARHHTSIVAPRIPQHQAWIEADSQMGMDYWEALQAARAWTKLNHFAIHDVIAKRLGNAIVGQFWNEHNFVFQKPDGLFYHAKGATPAFKGFAPDDQGLTLIPLNMGQPILIAEHIDGPETAMGFCPHGAGRNLSRTAHIKRLVVKHGSDGQLGSEAVKAIVKAETGDLDVRFFTGQPDVSELPSAYKNADQMQRQIEQFGLAKITDRVRPLGTIMAGEMNWHKARR